MSSLTNLSKIQVILADMLKYDAVQPYRTRFISRASAMTSLEPSSLPTAKLVLKEGLQPLEISIVVSVVQRVISDTARLGEPSPDEIVDVYGVVPSLMVPWVLIHGVVFRVDKCTA